MIFKVETYVDDEGRTVNCKMNEIKTIYIGHVTVATPNGLMPIDFPFPETNTSVEQCFKDFDDSFNLYIEEKRKEAKTRIIQPNELIK